MTLGMLASQQLAKAIAPGTMKNKWKLFRAICEARRLLGVTDRALTVLDALLTFYPGDEIAEGRGLVVFPSNAQLSLRARGMAPATLRRHLAVLVDAGLVFRKDSPNGKRYVRRDRAGEVKDAFGFSLAPLLARSAEIEAMAAQTTADREMLRVTKERLTLCRRDVAKLIETAIEIGIPGDWHNIHITFRVLVDSVPRAATVENLSPVLDDMQLLRQQILNQLKINIKVGQMGANESQNERHIQNSHPESISEFETACDNSEDAQGTTIERPKTAALKTTETLTKRVSFSTDTDVRLKSYPLGLVLQACPEIAAYGPGGAVSSWRDLMIASVVVRTMLGVSPSAYRQACGLLGPENAATVIACILERGGHIKSAGGYLRDLSRRAEKGEFAIGPMLMSLARANGGVEAAKAS
jgi:replication initiation protein RepC